MRKRNEKEPCEEGGEREKKLYLTTDHMYSREDEWRPITRLLLAEQ